MIETTEVQPLTEFLLARIAEDEAAAQGMIDGARDWWARDAQSRVQDVVDAFDSGPGEPSRVLAECAAKRRLIKGFELFGELDDMFAPEILSILATPYTDHPDYRSEWAQ